MLVRRFCAAIALFIALTAVPAASASTLAATGVAVPSATPNTSTPLTGVSLSGDTTDELYVEVATDVGTISIEDSSPEGTLAYGYTSWTDQSSVAFTATQAQADDDLATLSIDPGNSAGETAHVSVTAFPYDPSSDMVYSPTNGHFYQYVSASDITWAQAAADAAAMDYGSQQGYLATIPSETINDLITSKIPDAESVWFGAYATDSSGSPARTWRWYAGPLAGEAILTCNDLSTQNQNSTSQDNSECQPVNDAYVNWSDGEPNDDGNGIVCSDPLDQEPLGTLTQACSEGEHYAVTNWGAYNGLWNDLPNDGDGGASGYVVEYGDEADGTASPFTGVAAVTSNIVVGTVPSEPTSVAATVADTNATVSWTAPSDDGGWPVANYTATASTGQSCTVQAPATSCVITGLPRGVPVTFTVTDSSAYGSSTASAATSAVTPPTLPTIQMNAPPSLVGTIQLTATVTSQVPITNVEFQYELAGTSAHDTASGWQTACTTSAGASGVYTCAFNTSGLTAGAEYRFQAIAIDIYGDSAESDGNGSGPQDGVGSNVTSATTPTPPHIAGKVTVAAGSPRSTAKSGVLTISATGSKAASDSKIISYVWASNGTVVGRGRVLRFHPPKPNRAYEVTLTVVASNGTDAQRTFRVELIERHLTTTLHFGYNAAALTAADTSALTQLAQRIKRLSGQRPQATSIKVTGYASASVQPFGAHDTANELRLSRLRALAAGTRLVNSLRGHALTLHSSWHGAAAPVATNLSLSGQAKNRRVDVTVTERVAKLSVLG